MQTHLADFIRDTAAGREAEANLRRCTHCGFCLATCPTYQLLGDELDSPRGRIYLIKQVLEGATPGPITRLHLDRCLTCRACETTCPSGVEYHRLVDLGRRLVEEQAPRPFSPLRWALKRFVPQRGFMSIVVGAARLLPAAWRPKTVPPTGGRPERLPPVRHRRRMVALQGCVQPAMAPSIHPATVRLLDRLGIGITPTGDGCCGAVDLHLGDEETARRRARANIDAWWPEIDAGAEAVVVHASGCGVMVKEYGRLLADDPEYAGRAARIAELAADPVEILEREADRLTPAAGAPRRIAFHAPCTLQHGQRLQGRTERLLSGIGFELTPVADPHLCCGSAGTYSLLQPALARELRDHRLTALTGGEPELIATANIGCLGHLASASPVPVRHWIELLEVATATDRPPLGNKGVRR